NTALKHGRAMFRELNVSLHFYSPWIYNLAHTIVAHGMLPVVREDAEICLDIGEELIELLPGG
ncbi:MAG: hypothetical protein Q4A13_05790, partial [Fretibacterium sp.]|nr:hypothetical protein [Fretibacterium sp.]